MCNGRKDVELDLSSSLGLCFGEVISPLPWVGGKNSSFWGLIWELRETTRKSWVHSVQLAGAPSSSHRESPPDSVHVCDRDWNPFPAFLLVLGPTTWGSEIAVLRSNVPFEKNSHQDANSELPYSQIHESDVALSLLWRVEVHTGCSACQGAWVKREFNQQGIGEDEVGEGRKK